MIGLVVPSEHVAGTLLIVTLTIGIGPGYWSAITTRVFGPVSRVPGFGAGLSTSRTRVGQHGKRRMRGNRVRVRQGDDGMRWSIRSPARAFSCHRNGRLSRTVPPQTSHMAA